MALHPIGLDQNRPFTFRRTRIQERAMLVLKPMSPWERGRGHVYQKQWYCDQRTQNMFIEEGFGLSVVSNMDAETFHTWFWVRTGSVLGKIQEFRRLELGAGVVFHPHRNPVETPCGLNVAAEKWGKNVEKCLTWTFSPGIFWGISSWTIDKDKSHVRLFLVTSRIVERKHWKHEMHIKESGKTSPFLCSPEKAQWKKAMFMKPLGGYV